MASKGMRSFERNHYFYGKLMTARDFKAEQEYHREKDWLHNRLAHDYGVVGGLTITKEQEGGNPWRLVLNPGVAVDNLGREIVVPEPQGFDLSQLMLESGLSLSGLQLPVYLTLQYQEHEAEPVPVYAREHVTDDGTEPNRIQEGYKLAVVAELPAADGSEAQDLVTLMESALKPVDLAQAYKHLGGVSVAETGATQVAVAADSEDVLAATAAGKLFWVSAEKRTKLEVGDMGVSVVAIATAPSVAWIASASSIRMAMWPAGNAPALTLEHADNNIRALAAPQAQADAESPKVYYLAGVEDVSGNYTRLAELRADGTMVEKRKLAPNTVGLAISADSETLYYMQEVDGTWNLYAYDLETEKERLEEWGAALPVGTPVELRVGKADPGEAIMIVTDLACQVRQGGHVQNVTLPTDWKVRQSSALQWPRALFVGVNSADLSQLYVWDLANRQPVTYLWLEGQPVSLSARPAPSFRAYTGTRRGVEFIDVPVHETDLYRLLAERSLEVETGAPVSRPLVLGSVPFRNGLPDRDAIDNVSFRRVLVRSGDMSRLLTSLTSTVAKLSEQWTAPTQFTVTLEKLSQKPENGRYTLTLKAALKDLDGNPAPAGVAVRWGLLGSDEGGLAIDATLTDSSGVALNTARGLMPEVDYTILVSVGNRGGSLPFKGAPVEPSYTVKLRVRSVTRGEGLLYDAQLEAEVRDQEGQISPDRTEVTWTVSPDGTDVAAITETADGIADNTILGMEAKTRYTVTASVGDQVATAQINTPSLTPASIEFKVDAFSLQGGYLTRLITATVKDSSGRALPQMPVTWSCLDGTLHHTTGQTSADGTATNYITGMQPGTTYAVKLTAGALAKGVDVTSTMVTMTYRVRANSSTTCDLLLEMTPSATGGTGGGVFWQAENTSANWLLQPSPVSGGKSTNELVGVPYGRPITVYAAAGESMAKVPVTVTLSIDAQLKDDWSYVSSGLQRNMVVTVKANGQPLIYNKVECHLTLKTGDTTELLADTLWGPPNSDGQVTVQCRRMQPGSQYKFRVLLGGTESVREFTAPNFGMEYSLSNNGDGTFKVEVRATVKNAAGDPIPNHRVYWSVSPSARFLSDWSDTNVSGVATGIIERMTGREFTLTAYSTAGAGILPVVRNVARIALTSGGWYYNQNNTSLPQRRITATVTDTFGVPVPVAGIPITFGLDYTWMATFENAGPTNTNSDGKVQTTLYAQNFGTYNITATSGSISATLPTQLRQFTEGEVIVKATAAGNNLYTISGRVRPTQVEPRHHDGDEVFWGGYYWNVATTQLKDGQTENQALNVPNSYQWISVGTPYAATYYYVYPSQLAGSSTFTMTAAAPQEETTMARLSAAPETVEAQLTPETAEAVVPSYALTVTPIPADESGEGGFAVDLRDPDGVLVKGATVRYVIRGDGEEKVGKLVTSKAQTPKPVTVMGLKPGVEYEIEVTGKDLSQTIRFRP